MKINVHSLVGEFGITLDDGKKLFDAIRPDLLAERPVELDFSGVKVFASPFFNASIGKLLADVTLAQLQSRLSWSNLTAVGESVLKLVLKNSEEYYRNPEARRAADSILTDKSE